MPDADWGVNYTMGRSQTGAKWSKCVACCAVLEKVQPCWCWENCVLRCFGAIGPSRWVARASPFWIVELVKYPKIRQILGHPRMTTGLFVCCCFFLVFGSYECVVLRVSSSYLKCSTVCCSWWFPDFVHCLVDIGGAGGDDGEGEDHEDVFGTWTKGPRIKHAMEWQWQNDSFTLCSWFILSCC